MDWIWARKTRSESILGEDLELSCLYLDSPKFL